MLIWRGWGILVFVLGLAPALLVQLAGDAVLGQGYYVAHRWPKFVALALGAGLVWLLARVLAGRPARVLVDKATGEEVTVSGGDHLLFVPVRFWPPVILLFGIWLGLFGPGK